jgi:hypothetical protein
LTLSNVGLARGKARDEFHAEISHPAQSRRIIDYIAIPTPSSAPASFVSRKNDDSIRYPSSDVIVDAGKKPRAHSLRRFTSADALVVPDAGWMGSRFMTFWMFKAIHRNSHGTR